MECVCAQDPGYRSFSQGPKLGSTALLPTPTPFPEPQNSSFLHLINNWETISVRISKMIHLQKTGSLASFVKSFDFKKPAKSFFFVHMATVHENFNLRYVTNNKTLTAKHVIANC